jgi:OmcA/MtrC family decaheme c-type cytochrome
MGGKPYQIVGFGNVVHDYSKVLIPSEPHNCEKCHETSATQSNAYLTRPNRAACGACHDDVNFASGQGHANGIPQANDNACSQCHIPQGEIDFDASIQGAHVDPQESSLITGIVAKITSIENGRAGERPIVNFTLTDRKGALLEPSKVDRMNLVLAGPATDFGDGLPAAGGYVSESAKAATATQSGWRYQFTQAIPSTAQGSYAIAAEARRREIVLPGTVKEMEVSSGSPNDIAYFSVDGSAVTPRRKVVDLQKCNDCHRYLSVHGENRNNTEYCVMCHNPAMTDAARRPADKGPPEAIDFALMIHRIHAGNRQTRDYTLYGFGNTPHNYNHVGFPGLLNNCLNCHLDRTYNVPPPARLDKTDPRGWVSPAMPSNAACGGCHVSRDTASHALVNTSSLGESCAVCHGPKASYSVDRVHAQ